MKKVLIIGFFWPYCGGSKRIIGLAKYLPEFGWEPIILTGPLERRPDPRFRVIETPYEGFLGSVTRFCGISPQKDLGTQLQTKVQKTPVILKRILRYLYNFLMEILAIPDEHKNWKPYAIKSADEFIRKENIDAIISVWPVTSHIIAKELKERYKIPWLADFPELWSENVAYSYGLVRRMWDKKMEKEVLKKADALVTISMPMVEVLRKLQKNKAVSLITHGFDPGIADPLPKNLKEKFTITYTGTFYSKKRDPLKFFIALSSLLSEKKIDGKEIEVRFYGPKKEDIERGIKKYGLSDIVKQFGVIPMEQSLEKQKESQVLLFLDWDDPKEKGVYSGKIFEYLAAGRPILSTGGVEDNVVYKLLKETKTGISCPKIEDIKDVLMEFYLEHKQNGKIAYNGDSVEINKYSHREMARKFVDILNEIN